AFAQCCVPRVAVFVGQRDTGGEFGAVFREMIVVGIIEDGIPGFGEAAADARFSGAAYAHQDHGGWVLDPAAPMKGERTSRATRKARCRPASVLPKVSSSTSMHTGPS